MSRTTSAHLPTDKYAARANTRRRLRTASERDHKPAKAARKATRAALSEARKGYFP